MSASTSSTGYPKHSFPTTDRIKNVLKSSDPGPAYICPYLSVPCY
jgi:hypothetical protein